MELDGKPFQFKRNKLFRHRVFVKKCDTKGAILGNQLCWIPPEKTYDSMGRIQMYPECFAMRTMFPEKCQMVGLPFHNAIAFWNNFLGGDLQLTDEDRYALILRATCNYGDFFTYATTRALPKNNVCLEDLNTSALGNLEEQQFKELQEAILDQINRISMNLPESELSLENFDRFRRAWNFQLQMARRFQQWKVRYDSLKLKRYSVKDFDKLNNHDTLRPLVRIFRQYIQLLNGYTNSTRHQDFKLKYDEFEADIENTLFFSFDQIVFLLKEHEELALIAPMYVLALFQQLTKKLYTGLSVTSTTQLKVKLADLPNTKPQLYKRAKSNTKAPRNIQVITYQILCEYFQKCGFLKTPYDRALCDHILQFYLPLIGQPYFEVNSSQVDGIINSKECYQITDFNVTKKWIHFLLGEISERLEKSLLLDSNSIPKISYTSLMDSNSRDYIDQAKKVVDSGFVEQYLNIFILPPDGLGCPRISERVQVELAELMDQTLVKSNLPTNAYDRLVIEKLSAFETGFHEACAKKIFDLYYEEVLCFLYGFLQSTAFLHGEPIGDINKSPQVSEEDVSVWPPPQHPLNKLNIVNRSDFEYIEPKQ